MKTLKVQEELLLIKKTDFVLDHNPDLKKASEKLLKKIIKETQCTGGAILFKPYSTKTIELLAKKGRLDHKLIHQCFTTKKKITKTTKLCVPIILEQSLLGVVYVYGFKQLENVSLIIEDLELLLDGRFKYEKDNFGVYKLFRRYVSDAVAKKIVTQKNKLFEDGERHNCSVLFADLNGFTDFSNNVEPEHVVKVLNELFSAVIPEIQSLGGTVSQIVGDELMVIFGSPFPQKNHAQKAITTAKIIRKKAKKVLKKEPKGLNGVSIGIASGRVVAGNVGHDLFARYTVTGPKVNLAARLTGLAGTNEILVDEETYSATKKNNYKEVGYKKLKGFTYDVKIYKLLT